MSQTADTSDYMNNPFVHREKYDQPPLDSAPSSAAKPQQTSPTPNAGPTVPQIEVRVLTQQEQQSSFNENITSRKQYINWYFRLRSLAGVNLFVFLFLGLVAFFYSIRVENAAVFGYSVLILFYSLSSFIFFYRFPKTVNRERDIRENREAKASVLMTCLFMAMGFLLLVLSLSRMATAVGPELGNTAATITMITVLTSVFGGTLQSVAGSKVDSFVVFKGAMLSYSLALISFFMAISSVVYYYNSAIWWVDALLSLFLSVAFLAGGTRSLLGHSAQIRLWMCPPTLPTTSNNLPTNVTLSELDKQWIPEQPRSTAQA